MLTQEKRNELVELIVANSGCDDCDEAQQSLQALPEPLLLKLAVNMSDEEEVPAEDEEMEDEEEEAPFPPKKKPPMAANADAKQWWDSAPEAIKALVSNASEALGELQAEHIKVITANKLNPFSREELAEMPVKRLKQLAAMAKAQPVANADKGKTYPSFIGNAGGVPTGATVVNKGKGKAETADPDLLPIPVMNFAADENK